MDTKIAITPRLDKQASKEFRKKVSDGLCQPVGPKPTPKLDAVLKKFSADAIHRPK